MDTSHFWSGISRALSAFLSACADELDKEPRPTPGGGLYGAGEAESLASGSTSATELERGYAQAYLDEEDELYSDG